MIVDVSSILKETGGIIHIDGEVAVEEIEFCGNSYSFKTPFRVLGSVSNNGTTLVLEADCSAIVKTQCSRCMKDIDVPIDFEISETLVQGEEKQDEFEDVIVFEGYEISIDEIVSNNFIMNVDARYLCKDDCKGLCPSCGKDLNEGECNCNNDNIDPRWAKLAEMIEKND